MKSITAQMAIALIATLGLALSACSDDELDDEQSNQTPVEDAGHDEGTGELDGGEPDAGESDVDDGEVGDADAGPAEDADSGGGLAPEFDVEPVECAYPSDDPSCEPAPFGPASFFNHFHIETRDEEDACCTDLTGDGIIDNYIGENLVAAVAGGNVPGFQDINQNILASIQTGELTYLMEAVGWSHPLWEGDMELRVYKGGSSTDSMEDNLAGEGSFNLSPANFDSQGDPLFGFEHTEVRDGELSATGGRIKVMFPGLVEAIGAELGGVEITADVVQSPAPDLTAGGGFSLVNGELGGAILRDTFYKSMNEESLYCDCLELDDVDTSNPDLWKDGLFTYQEGDGEWVDGEFVYDEGENVRPGEWVCDWKAEGGDTCEEPSEPVECQTLGNQQLCSILGVFSDETDVWIDGEPSFSIGVHFETVPTDIIAVEPE